MSLPPQADIPQQLSQASARWTRLRRMIRYAAFDGWTLAVLGALSLICDGYRSVPGVIISLTLLATGSFEIHTTRQLRRLHRNAITHLAYNQFALAAVVTLYALFNLIQAHTSSTPISSELEQTLAQIGTSPSDLHDQYASAMTIFYTGVIILTLLIQGSTAFFYLSRRRHLQEYLDQTPEWIQQMQRERGEVSI